jgi:hypothetical protein
MRVATNIITIVFSALLAVFLAGSISAFLLAVPAVSLISLVLVLLAMILMFALGLYAGGRRIRIRRRHV